MINSKAQIVATMGPATANLEVLTKMAEHNLDVARLNFSWSDFGVHTRMIENIRKASAAAGRKILIIGDLSGPRIQEGANHTYDNNVISAVTERDVEYIKFGITQGIDYFAMSFVGGPEDVVNCKKIISENGGTQKVIAKIERKIAVDSFEKIVAVADAIMVARGDLGNEIPIEQIPFVQAEIVKKSKEAGKPVIVATQMLLSMVNNPIPTRAEVTDVSSAISEGADAVMLSEETAIGKDPVEVVMTMEKIVLEAERHLGNKLHINAL